jgi:hypothetical protein
MALNRSTIAASLVLACALQSAFQDAKELSERIYVLARAFLRME